MSNKLLDYQFAPPHPDHWTGILTRDLEEYELFQVQSWLRLMAGSGYDIITHYVPAFRMVIYFGRSQDAAMFKLAWGGN